MNITNLNVCNNTGITSAGLTTLTKLTDLNIGNTGITALDLSQNTELTWLSLIQCSGLTTIDLSHNTKLQSLSAQSSGLTELELNYVHPALTSLEVGGCNSLETLRLYQCTGLTSLNLVNDVALKDLFVPFCTNLTSIDVSYCNALENVILWDCTALTTLTGMKKTACLYVTATNSGTPLKRSIYQVGQLVKVDDSRNFTGSMGVVYTLDDDSQVKVVSVDEDEKIWGIYGSNDEMPGCDADKNGWYNTQQIPDSPAAQWCTGHGYGWYFPAYEELYSILQNKAALNETLSAAGYTKIYDEPREAISYGYLQGRFYWSSTEAGNYEAYIYETWEDEVDYLHSSPMKEAHYVRAVYMVSNVN